METYNMATCNMVFYKCPDMHLSPHNSKPISTQKKAAKGRSAHQDFAFL